MIEIVLNEDNEGNYIIYLSTNGKFIKKIAQCFEKDYAVLIASSLAKNSNSELKINIKD